MTNLVSSPPRLTREWSDWILQSLLLAVARDEISRTLVSHAAFTPAEARQHVDEVSRSELFALTNRNQQSLRKLESLLDNLERVRLMGATHHFISRRARIGAHEFFEQFYATNTPVLIEEFARRWPAAKRWTPQFFKENYGHYLVEVMAERESDPRYEERFERHRQEVPLAGFIDGLCSLGGNNSYLVANNQLLERPEFARLHVDLSPDPQIVPPSTMEHGGAFLWLGGAGTITPLHHDVENVLFVQIYGSKRFTLISPYQSHRVYNDVSVYSDVDIAQPDRERHPLFDSVSRLEVTVGPGEALLIPVGWWHHVESLEVSISVSFIQFAYPNEFHWQLPQLPHLP